MNHYELTPQERTQITGRWHGVRAPLCATGDGHYIGVNPDDWQGSVVKVDCAACCAQQHLVASRERSLVFWSTAA
jgi:hypothetical protein